MQAAIFAHDQVVVSSREQDFAHSRLMSFSGQLHAAACLLGEPLAQTRGKCRIDMLNDDDARRERGGKPRKDLGQGLRTAGRGSQRRRGDRASFQPGKSAMLEDELRRCSDRSFGFSPGLPRSLPISSILCKSSAAPLISPRGPRVGVSIASSAP